MKAEESTISQILTDPVVHSIPPYQRPYSWERGNVRQLLEDLWDACRLLRKTDQDFFRRYVRDAQPPLPRRHQILMMMSL